MKNIIYLMFAFAIYATDIMPAVVIPPCKDGKRMAMIQTTKHIYEDIYPDIVSEGYGAFAGKKLIAEPLSVIDKQKWDSRVNCYLTYLDTSIKEDDFEHITPAWDQKVWLANLAGVNKDIFDNLVILEKSYNQETHKIVGAASAVNKINTLVKETNSMVKIFEPILSKFGTFGKLPNISKAKTEEDKLLVITYALTIALNFIVSDIQKAVAKL